MHIYKETMIVNESIFYIDFVLRVYNYNVNIVIGGDLNNEDLYLHNKIYRITGNKLLSGTPPPIK